MTNTESKGEPIPSRSVSAKGGSVAVGGDVVKSNIHVGHNVRRGESVDLKDFLAELAELRKSLRESPLDAEAAKDLDAEAEGVREQAEREKPSRTMILGKLKTITDTVTSAAGAADKLVPLARRLVEMAADLF